MHCHKLSFKVEIYSSMLSTLFTSTLFMTTFGFNLSCKVFILSPGTVNFTISPISLIIWGSYGTSLFSVTPSPFPPGVFQGVL